MVKKKDDDLHGNAPDNCPYALLLIDVVNAMDFPGGERLLRNAMPVARRIAALTRRARTAGVPVIYVNDNFGRWRSDFNSHVRHCLNAGVPGEPVVRLLKPEANDYFVLKPKHSGFFSTSLDILLRHLSVTRLILTGFAGNLCVLYTANDAYMRDYELIVPRDCLASEKVTANEHAIKEMSLHLKADVRASTRLRFPAKLKRSSATGR